MFKRYLLIAAATLLLAPVLRADMSYKGKTEIGVQAGGIFFEGRSWLDQEDIYGGRIGHYLTDNLSVEAAALWTKTEVRTVSGDGKSAINSNAEAEIFIPTGEIQYHFGHSSFRPFVAVGAGDFHTNPLSGVGNLGYSSNKTDDFIVQYGAGVKWMITQCLAFRVDARHIINTEHGYRPFGISKNDGTATAGLSVLFGGEKKEEAPKAAAAPVVLDSDGDGVPDSVDRCLGTPPGTKVDATGCPVDSDGDGVPDDKDKCPGTPAGTKVDATGCPVVVDSDGDGVPDDKDECPGTPVGTAVDATGCPQTVKAIQDMGVLKGVQFESGSDKIKGSTASALDETAEILKARTKDRVEIEGHTDNTGGTALNQTLSEKRAISVKNYLVSKGVSPDQLETKGYGETVPIADNKTAAGRAQNRRIEFKVLSR